MGVAVFGAGSAVAPATGQWHVIRLHDPTTMISSNVYAVSPTLQGGWVGYSATSQVDPTLWSGSSSSAINLTPGGESGEVSGIYGEQKVGYFNRRATIWSGATNMPTQLGDPAWYWSEAMATTGEEQVGWYYPAAGGYTRAALWRGTAASRVDLHPTGALDSAAVACMPSVQGGYVRFGSAPNITLYRAALWRGSAGSFVNMNPPGCQESQIFGMAGDQQAGSASRFAQGGHAGLWHGTPESWIDLHPPGLYSSRLLATCGSAQAGLFTTGGLTVHAGIWFGTPESFTRLDVLLPPGYSHSWATSIAFDGQRYYVGGMAASLATGYDDAFLWISDRCYPNCDLSTRFPVLNVNDFVCFSQKFAAGDPYANCDGSTEPPALNVADFVCFMQAFAAGCR